MAARGRAAVCLAACLVARAAALVRHAAEDWPVFVAEEPLRGAAVVASAPQRTAVALVQGSEQHLYKANQTDHFKEGGVTMLGVMNHNGVTRYSSEKVRRVRKKSGFFWPDPGNAEGSRYKGAADLTDNVSWGWHHPNGVYNSIPVGAPLIDDEMSIYLGSDDAVRKFTVAGDLIWSYGPRGQLAAAPTLILPDDRRRAPGTEQDAEAEEELRPGGAGGEHPQASGNFWREHELEYDAAFGEVRVGDRLRVRPREGFHSGGKEYYRSGDEGVVARIVGAGGARSAVVRWPRTSRSSQARLSSLHKRFVHLKAEAAKTVGLLVGSTTSGYVFAVDLATGDEVWATKVSDQIQGVKGAVSGRNGVVVAATDRCRDRYCYRYRNTSNPLTPSNAVVRGLSTTDGSALWEFRPASPVWNMVPQYGRDGDSVMFSDFEGTAYCLDLETGQLRWQHDGAMGTYTQAFALYFGTADLLYSMGLKNEESYSYEHKHCNPFPAPGILPACGTWPGSPGWFKALNASSGRARWEYDLYEPPAAAGLGEMHRGASRGTRLIVVSGHNCKYGSKSQIMAVDATDGNFYWEQDGPTLWNDQCAGDREGGDIRRAMGGRAQCQPSSWSMPAMDMYGDLYLGSQVGELQRWGTRDGTHGSRRIELLSTLTTGVAFQDQAIAFAPGIMAVATCTSLIVFNTNDGQQSTIGITDWEMVPGPPRQDSSSVYRNSNGTS